MIRRIDHRLALLDQLADLRTELAADRSELVTVVEELIAIESDALLATTAPASPVAGLARYLLRAADLPGLTGLVGQNTGSDSPNSNSMFSMGE